MDSATICKKTGYVNPACRTLGGFTLIEVLVVVVILLLLSGMMLTGIASGRQAARKATCANNLRQFGVAIQSFAMQHNDRFPESSHTAGVDLQRAWIVRLKPYVENSSQIHLCPADPRGEAVLTQGGSSYTLNEYLCVPGPLAALTLGRVKNKSRTISLFTASSNQAAGPMNDHTHSRGWFGADPVKNWNRILKDISPDRFGDAANYLFVDGHVESMELEAVKSWSDSNVNFAAPQ